MRNKIIYPDLCPSCGLNLSEFHEYALIVKQNEELKNELNKLKLDMSNMTNMYDMYDIESDIEEKAEKMAEELAEDIINKSVPRLLEIIKESFIIQERIIKNNDSLKQKMMITNIKKSIEDCRTTLKKYGISSYNPYV